MTPLLVVSVFRFCTSVGIETSALSSGLGMTMVFVSFPPSSPGKWRCWMGCQSNHTVSFSDRSIPRVNHVSPGLHNGGYWWIILWLIWADPWSQLLHKVAFHHGCLRSTVTGSLISVCQGKRVERSGPQNCWQLCLDFTKGVSSNAHGIPLGWLNYPAIW